MPFRFSAEQIGAACPERLAARIMELRRAHRDALRATAGAVFAPLAAEAPTPGLTVLENAVFGKLSLSAGAAAEKALRTVSGRLDEVGAELFRPPPAPTAPPSERVAAS